MIHYDNDEKATGSNSKAVEVEVTCINSCNLDSNSVLVIHTVSDSRWRWRGRVVGYSNSRSRWRGRFIAQLGADSHQLFTWVNTRLLWVRQRHLHRLFTFTAEREREIECVEVFIVGGEGEVVSADALDWLVISRQSCGERCQSPSSLPRTYTRCFSTTNRTEASSFGSVGSNPNSAGTFYQQVRRNTCVGSLPYSVNLPAIK